VYQREILIDALLMSVIMAMYMYINDAILVQYFFTRTFKIVLSYTLAINFYNHILIFLDSRLVFQVI
jgi:hypothetical protein